MDYLQVKLHNKYPNLLVSVHKVSLSFPAGLRLTGLELRTQVSPEQTVFSAKRIIIRPKLMSLLGSNPRYRFTCQAYDGTITGQADIRKIGEETSFNLSTQIIKIHIDENSPLPAYIKDYFIGILEGTITFSGSGLFDPEGTGEAALKLSNGSVKFAQPLLNINVIDFEEMPVKAELKDQNLNISDARLKGKDFLGQASGLISLKSPVKESRLNIKFNIEPTAAFMQDSSRNDSASNLIKEVLKNGKTFNIKGTIENPSF
jgi:type II secretion system protein N